MDKKSQALIELYAKNLLELAQEKDSLEPIYQDSQALATIFRDNPNLGNFLVNQASSRAEKAQLMTLLREGSSPYMKNFLALLAENGREGLLPAMIDQVLERLSHMTGHFDIEVSTAVALSDQQKARLIELVQTKFGIKSRQLIETIDPSLLGGFVIKADNKVLDTSIRRQLQDLKMNLK